MSWISPILRASCLLSILLAARGVPAAPARYTLQDLGEAAGVAGLNSTGMVVGSRRAPAFTAVRWQIGHAPLDLVAPPAVETSQGQGIGEDGAVVGSGERLGGRPRAFVWTESQGLQLLGFVDNQPAVTEALSLNTVQVIVGYTTDPPRLNPVSPVIWIGGQAHALPTLGGSAVARAVNDAGDIVGSAALPESLQNHAVLWPLAGGILDLQPLTATSSYADALTTDQRVVGTVCFPAGCLGFLWTAATGMQPLPLLAGDEAAVATGINAAGHIIGRGQATGGLQGHALLWEAGTPYDLQTLVEAPGWALEIATGINALGQIAGAGVINGAFHAFLLTPVVPPAPGPPVALVVVVHGDLNGDGWPDLAGIDETTALWRCLAGDAACTQLPGRAVELVACDVDGNGTDDLIALSSDTAIWSMTDSATWRQLPGRLRHVGCGNFLGRTHQRQLVGLAADTSIWIAPEFGAWHVVPGYLKRLIIGKFTGGPLDELAGIGWDTSIWHSPSIGQWEALYGNLVTIRTVPGQPDGIEGLAADGVLWRADRLNAWYRVGQSQRVATSP